MPVLEIPKYFSLRETLKVLRRGESDPINFCDSGKWTRYLSSSNESAIVEVFDESGVISINIVKGEMNDQLVKEQIFALLGLDDPLIQEDAKEFKLKKYAHIKCVRSTSLPRYSSLFETMIQTILGQLVSASVANKMRHDFIKKFGENSGYNDREYYIFPTSSDIKNINIEKIKNIGISNVKARSVLDAAEHFENKNWVRELTDESTSISRLYTLLTNVYGVGEWTASWFILRGLRKFDQVPSADLVIKKAMSWWWKKEKLLTSSEIDELAESMKQNRGLICYRIMLIYMKKFMNNNT